MKPSERIYQLYNKQPYPGYAGAIAQYLDEQYEKEHMASSESVYETKVEISSRNALIDELIQEVGMISHIFVTENVATRYIDPEEVTKILKSKKK